MPELWRNPSKKQNFLLDCSLLLSHVCEVEIVDTLSTLVPKHQEVIQMNFFTKKLSVIAIVLATLGFSAVASAECMQEGSCFDTYQGVSLGGSATFGGFGAGVFTGESGGVLIEKSGYADTNTTLSIAGDLCGADCQDGSFTHDASAGEWVSAIAGAAGTTPGEGVSVLNEGGAFSGVSFEFGKVNISPADQ